jgi:hypothetical protein
MQRVSQQTGIAAADGCREKWLHLRETIRAAAAQAFDNSERAASYIPSKRTGVQLEDSKLNFFG